MQYNRPIYKGFSSFYFYFQPCLWHDLIIRATIFVYTYMYSIIDIYTVQVFFISPFSLITDIQRTLSFDLLSASLRFLCRSIRRNWRLRRWMLKRYSRCRELLSCAACCSFFLAPYERAPNKRLTIYCMQPIYAISQRV